MIQRLDKDLPFVKVAKNSGTDLKQTIEAYYDEKPIVIPKGTYTLTDIIDGITLTEDIHPKIIGVGSRAVQIVSAQTKVFEIANTAFLANKTHRLTMGGFTIDHDCSNATDITLDLKNAQHYLFDIGGNQQNATKQGIFLETGKETAQSPTGQPNSIKNCSATQYGDGFKIGLDHTIIENCIANLCTNKGFWMERRVTEYISWVKLFGCETLSSAANRATCYPYYWKFIGWGNGMDTCQHEDSTAITNNLIYIDSGTTSYYVLPVTNFGFHHNQDAVLTNDFERVKFGLTSHLYNDLQPTGEWEDVNADPYPDPTGGAWEGRRVTMYNAHATFAANPYRAYYYINGGWHYSILDA